MGCVRSYSKHSRSQSSPFSFFRAAAFMMLNLLEFSRDGKTAFLIGEVSPRQVLHCVAVDEEQIPHRTELQHFLIKRRRTRRGLTPHCFHSKRVCQVHEAGEDTAADAGNRLVGEGHAGTNGKKIEERW